MVCFKVRAMYFRVDQCLADDPRQSSDRIETVLRRLSSLEETLKSHVQAEPNDSRAEKPTIEQTHLDAVVPDTSTAVDSDISHESRSRSPSTKQSAFLETRTYGEHIPLPDDSGQDEPAINSNHPISRQAQVYLQGELGFQADMNTERKRFLESGLALLEKDSSNETSNQLADNDLEEIDFYSEDMYPSPEFLYMMLNGMMLFV